MFLFIKKLRYTPDRDCYKLRLLLVRSGAKLFFASVIRERSPLIIIFLNCLELVLELAILIIAATALIIGLTKINHKDNR